MTGDPVAPPTERRYAKQFIPASTSQDGRGHWRIADGEDNRVATCWDSYNADRIVDALNEQWNRRRSPSPSPAPLEIPGSYPAGGIPITSANVSQLRDWVNFTLQLAREGKTPRPSDLQLAETSLDMLADSCNALLERVESPRGHTARNGR